MYEKFFSFDKKPFELVPDPDFIYLSRSHRRALTYLDYGIRERAGFILLTGEVGSGKTTLIRDLLKKNYPKVVLAKVFNTLVNSEQLLAMINDDFGLPVAGKDKLTLMRELNDFLLEQYAKGNRPMLIVDEAQNLAPELLEEIRMLSNLESSHAKLLQIMLVGQPELRDTLASPELMQLRQRISINCHLRALCLEETGEYLTRRMEVAGNAAAVHFPGDSLELIHRCSRGIPRLINILCDFLMLGAFAEEVRSIPLEMVRDVVGDLDFENHYWGDSLQRAALRPCEARAPDPGAAPALSQRLDQAEHEFSLRTPAALRELCDSVALMKEDFSARMVKWEALVSELDGRLAGLSVQRDRRELQSGSRAGAGGGFMRRLFGGADSHGA